MYQTFKLKMLRNANAIQPNIWKAQKPGKFTVELAAGSVLMCLNTGNLPSIGIRSIVWQNRARGRAQIRLKNSLKIGLRSSLRVHTEVLS